MCQLWATGFMLCTRVRAGGSGGGGGSGMRAGKAVVAGAARDKQEQTVRGVDPMVAHEDVSEDPAPVEEESSRLERVSCR